MSRRELAPFRADHVGSLLRSPELASARAAFGVQQVEGESIHVRLRGETGELDYASPAIAVTSRVTLPEAIFADAFGFLRDHALPGQTAQADDPVTEHGPLPRRQTRPFTPPPTPTSTRSGRTAPPPTAPNCTGSTSSAVVTCSSTTRASPTSMQECYIAAINEVLDGRPDDLVVTTHMCRGNNQSMWVAEGGYDFVAEALFGDLNVDGYFLEFDDERSGTFAPLRFVPAGKLVVLGPVTTKRPELEDRDALTRRIEQAADHVDSEQLCLSPQCGFSSTEEGNRLTIDDERAKLELVVRVADEAPGPGGLMLNHGIARMTTDPPNPKSFIARYVFPDGELHPVADLVASLQGSGLEVRDVESLREHYPLTLRRWLANLRSGHDVALALVGPSARAPGTSTCSAPPRPSRPARSPSTRCSRRGPGRRTGCRSTA